MLFILAGTDQNNQQPGIDYSTPSRQGFHQVDRTFDLSLYKHSSDILFWILGRKFDIFSIRHSKIIDILLFASLRYQSWFGVLPPRKMGLSSFF